MAIGIATAIPFGSGLDWIAYWASQDEVLFFAETKNIADGKLYNQKSGATDYLTVTGAAGSYTFQCPDEAPYIAADTDFVWFREGDSSRRIATEEDLIGFDFIRTIIKYGNTSPYSLEAIMILSSDVDTARIRNDFHLSVWWDDTLSLYGDTKGNRASERSVWNLGYTDETIAYIARVVADGGTITVAEQELTDADIRMLKTNAVFATMDRILVPYGGKKLRFADPDYFVTKLYDIKGATGDFTQATEAQQPEYGADQYNSIDVFTTTVSMMAMAASFVWRTAILVSGGDGYILGDSGGAYLRSRATLVVVRDNAADATAHTVINKVMKIDSIIESGTDCNVWRNKTASAENPLTKGVIQSGQLFQRFASTYFAGTWGLALLSATAISEAKKALIEDYYIAKFNIT